MSRLWRTVPMPPNVAKLPRTPSGMPVVYITQYAARGVEKQTKFVDLFPGKGKLDCDCEFGAGRAMIGAQCPRRQADAVLNRKCGVCGVVIKEGREMVFVGAEYGITGLPGERVFMTTEAGVHHDCATYSLLTCPAMHGRDDVKLVFAREFDLYVRVHADRNDSDRYVTVPVASLPDIPGRVVVSMYSMVFPATAKFMTSAQWLAQAPPLERPGLKAVMPAPEDTRV